MAARCRRTFAGAHAYHVNSLSLCSDGETFLSADDLRVNLWHLDAPAAPPYTLVDLKPPRMEDLTEVVTTAEFHPAHCALFCHASSKGVLRLGDLRAASTCDRPALAMAAPDPALDAALASGDSAAATAALVGATPKRAPALADAAAAARTATDLPLGPARSRLVQAVNADDAGESTGAFRVWGTATAATGGVGATDCRAGVRIAAAREARRFAEVPVADVDCCAASDP
jgi:hypothetical protein